MLNLIITEPATEHLHCESLAHETHLAAHNLLRTVSNRKDITCSRELDGNPVLKLNNSTVDLIRLYDQYGFVGAPTARFGYD